MPIMGAISPSPAPNECEALRLKVANVLAF